MSDDIPSSAEITKAGDRALEIYEELIDEVGDDRTGVGYALWTLLTRDLVEKGWTIEELLKETGYHAADQEAGGQQS